MLAFQFPARYWTHPNYCHAIARLRIEFDGLAVAGDGLVQLLLTEEGVAEVDVGIGVFRVEFDGLAVAGDGLVQLSPGLSGHGRGCSGPGRISGRFRWPCGSRRWPRPASSAVRGVAEVVVGLGVFRVEFDGLAVARRWPRPACPAPQVHFRGGRHGPRPGGLPSAPGPAGARPALASGTAVNSTFSRASMTARARADGSGSAAKLTDRLARASR